MTRVDSVLSGTVSALLGRLGIAIAGVATGALLARLLVPADLGRYLLLASIATIASTTSLFGVNQSVIKLVASARANGDNTRAGEYASATLLLGLLGALLGGGAVALLLNYLLESMGADRVAPWVCVLTGAWVVLLAIQTLLAESIRGYRQIARAVAVGGGLQAIATALALAVWWVSHVPFGLPQALLVVLGALTLGGGYGYMSLLPRLQLTIKRVRPAVRDTLHIAPSMWLTSILLTLLVQVDIWIVARTAGEDTVAVYGAAARLVAAVALPLVVANAVIPPFVSELYTRNRKNELAVLARSVATLTAIPAGLALLIFILFGGPVLSLVYGPTYTSGSRILELLSLGQAVNVLCGSCGLILILTGSERIMLLITGMTSVGGVLGALFLNRSLGPEGVAAAMAAAMIVQNILMVIAVRARVGIWTFVGTPRLGSLKRLALPSRY